MSPEQKAAAAPAVPAVIDAPKKRAPTLYAIIAFKLLKGLLFVALAIAAYHLSDNDLPAEYRKFLRILRAAGVAATLRREKGHDIDAACGQLRLQTLRTPSEATISSGR
jgi:hypothetical protein